ncbi:MAG: DUF2782 domain-containing protein [Nitrosomonadales bacterium]|jgi:hypothetical protein|nr:MAG: DUF2782 domain-containing protein [Nitrosomonadales bacterium]
MLRIRTLFFMSLCLPMLVLAADKPQLEPLPEPPPPPAGYEPDAVSEPQVTIVKRGEETVEEYRVGGELYMMKVTPSHGVPYYLLKEQKDGGWARMDGPGESLAIPNWVLFRF